MRFLEALNRMLVGMLISLVLLQAGLLFFMKNMEEQAQFRLVQNTSKVDSVCGQNIFSEEQYWNLEAENYLSSSACSSADCDFSHILWKRQNQNQELHLIAVRSAPPFRWGDMEQGGSIRVRVKASAQPQILALVSRDRLEWNFQVDVGAKIAKVIVATPQVVWLQGLPPKTDIEYLPKEKMCSYPFAWEDAFNPDNELRTVMTVLHKITGLQLTSFQGALVGKEFRVPLFDADHGVIARGLASAPSDSAPSVTAPAKSSAPAIFWKRLEQKVVPEKLVLSSEEIPFPEKTQAAVHVMGQTFITKDYLLWQWNSDKKEFQKFPTPTFFPTLQYVTALAVSETNQHLYVYNDQRGGELFKFDLQKQEWSQLNTGYNFYLEALHFDDQSGALYALASKGSYMTQILQLDPASGKVVQTNILKNKIAFDRRHWKWQLLKDKNQLWIRWHQPVAVQGTHTLLEI